MLDPSDEKQNTQLQDIFGILIFLFLMFSFCGVRPGDPRPAPPEDVNTAPLQKDEDLTKQSKTGNNP